MKVWITKYALIRGIIEAEPGIIGSYSVSIYRSKDYLPTNLFNIRSGDIHFSKESAIKKAEEMRQKEIERLKKQIKKLEEMRFE